MPELPEVETIRRTLSPRLAGRTIESVEVRTPKFIVGASPEAFERAVRGARIAGLGRRGKFLVINLDYPCAEGGASRVAEAEVRSAGTAPPPAETVGLCPEGDILVHLKMAGQLVWCGPGEDLGPTRTKHTHVVFRLDDGNELRYIDLRHFGRVYFTRGDAGDPALARALRTFRCLGPEPREGGGLEWESFRSRLGRRGARLKPLLLDQAFVAGLGNIYADECLFRARIHPLRRASSLDDHEARALFDAMKEVLTEAIDLRGTSVRDYVDGEGKRGGFAERLRAYGKTGKPCPRCGTPIERLVIGGRSSHFCPKCQKAPRTDV